MKQGILYEDAVGCAVMGVHFGVHTPEEFKLDLRGCRDLVVASADYILNNPEAFLQGVRIAQERGHR